MFTYARAAGSSTTSFTSATVGVSTASCVPSDTERGNVVRGRHAAPICHASRIRRGKL
jgi:hypothetical protein